MIDCALSYSYMNAIRCEIAATILYFLMGIPLPILLFFINKKIHEEGSKKQSKTPQKNGNKYKDYE